MFVCLLSVRPSPYIFMIHSFVSEVEEAPWVGMCGLGHGLGHNLDGLLFDSAVAHCQCFEGRGLAWLRQVFDYLNVISQRTINEIKMNVSTIQTQTLFKERWRKWTCFGFHLKKQNKRDCGWDVFFFKKITSVGKRIGLPFISTILQWCVCDLTRKKIKWERKKKEEATTTLIQIGFFFFFFIRTCSQALGPLLRLANRVTPVVFF